MMLSRLGMEKGVLGRVACVHVTSVSGKTGESSYGTHVPKQERAREGQGWTAVEENKFNLEFAEKRVSAVVTIIQAQEYKS